MAEVADHPTRVAADLYASAIVEGGRESRSARQQIDHWARIGRAVSAQVSVPRSRVQAALAGELPVDELSVEETVVFNAEINTAIEENLQHTDYTTRLAARGVTTVSLDDAGQLVAHHPDGTSTPLPTPAVAAPPAAAPVRRPRSRRR